VAQFRRAEVCSLPFVRVVRPLYAIAIMELTSRLILSLLSLQLSFVYAFQELGDSHSFLTGKEGLSNVEKLAAPVGCKKLSTDTDWPSADVVDAELPGWEAPMPDGKMKHPDYIYEAKSVASVQRAVRFVTKHNIRLSIINSGHDFLGR
jgi:hypothetical protein